MPVDVPTGAHAVPAFDESRRLTGPNRYVGGAAVVLDALGPRAGEPAAHARWAERVRAVCAALGWPDPQPVASARTERTVLAFAAPEAALYTATDINEWAWCGEADEATATATTFATAIATFAVQAARERSPPLERLKAAAQARGIDWIADDDTVSLGAGSGSLAWPRAALPLPMDVPWQRLHGVPTVLVTGSNGKTTTTRLLAACFEAAGLACGSCSTEGVVVHGRALVHGDYAGPAGARHVLRAPGVQAAVLETARGGLLRRGLAVPRADAAVVTNVSADHLGEYGIKDLDDIAQAKLVVAHALGRTGTLVLNAEDDVLIATASRLPHAARARQALFARAHGHPRLAALRARGGSTCGAHDGRLLLTEAGVEHELGAVAAMPLTVDGAATHNLENIAAAVLAARAAGLGIAAIAATLMRFGARPEDNAGRLEQHRHRGATVLIDYAHNPDGLAQLLRVARALAPRRLGLLLGQAGDRSDAAIADLARTAAGFTPDRVAIKELPAMRRGRPAGEVPALIAHALLAAGMAPDRLLHEADEEAAAHALLAWGRPGDVIVLPVHTAAVRERLAATLVRSDSRQTGDDEPRWEDSRSAAVRTADTERGGHGV